jgi:26S proteasome regulatory subunit N13
MQVFHFIALLITNAHESLQDASSRRDEELVDNVNRLLRDPDSIPIWNPNPVEISEAQASSSSTSSVEPSV